MTTSYNYDGTEHIGAGSTASYDATTIHNVSIDDYAATVDFNVDTMNTGTTYPVPTATVDLSEVLAKLDDLNRKVDHLLEHAHQPLYGTVNLEPPAKVGAGYTT